MRRLIVSLVWFGLVASFPSPASLQQPPPIVEQRGGFDISGPYQVDPNWPKKTWPAPGYIWGSQAGVYPESADKVFLVSRGEIELPKNLKTPPNFLGNWGALNRGGATGEVPVFRNNILVVDRQGNLIQSWTQWDHLFEGGRGPHQIYVQPYDPERHVWVVDDMNHVIHKFTNDGKTKVLTLGEMGVFGPNDDLQHFNRPTMIDWLPDGTFFVSDGYANSRVVKFNKDGKPLLWWGSMAPGKKDGEFTVPHGIAVELIVPNESFWGVDLQVKRASIELQKLENSLRAGGIDLRLLKEYRDAAEYVRTAAAAVKQLRDCQLQGHHDSEVMAFLSAERIRRTTTLCLEVLADLDAGRVSAETKGVEEYCRSLEQNLDRLKPLLKQSDAVALPGRRK